MKTPYKVLIPVVIGVMTLGALGIAAVFLYNQSSKTEDSTETSDSSDTESTADPCLEGNWVMERAMLDLFVSSAVPIQGLTVPEGQISMSFSGNEYNYSGQYTLRMSPSASMYLEAVARHTNSGTFSVSDGTLIFASEVNESEAMKWTAYQDGKLVSTSGSGPTYSYPQPGGGPYRCTSSTLEVDTKGANNQNLTMFFAKGD